MIDDGNALPDEAYGDFRIKVHAACEAALPHQHSACGQRIQAKAAHGVGEYAAAGVDMHPKVGEFVTPQALLGDGRVVARSTADKSLGMFPPEFEHVGHGPEVVLSVRIDLQHMRVSGKAGGHEAEHTGRSLAAVDGIAH